MFFQFLKVEWDRAAAKTLPKTLTPIDGLTERAALELSPVPLIIATGAGSLLKPMQGRHHVNAVGQMKHDGMIFYRVYLSNDPGTYLHLVAADNDPHTVLESRLYQPYAEINTPYQTLAEAQQFGGSPDLSREFWLLDNPDPAVGGIIGCPDMQGKNEDGGVIYHRSMATEDRRRIAPVQVNETILRADGYQTVVFHQMMHYGRALDNETDEFLLVSEVSKDDGLSINTWLGIDIKSHDLTIYPAT